LNLRHNPVTLDEEYLGKIHLKATNLQILDDETITPDADTFFASKATARHS
jgi:hypothetical protein